MIQAFPLDPETGDIKLNTSGQFSREQTFAELVAQRLTSRFRTVRGTCVLDSDAGLPLFTDVVVKRPNLTSLESMFRAEALRVDGVASISKMVVTVDNKESALIATFEGTCVDGTKFTGGTN